MKERPEIFKNERVSASAGSGKTYALTNRFIALAANAKDPETGLPDPSRITALTFTRKSAGEFLGKILTRLAEAAEDDKAADALSDEVEKLTRGTKSGGGFLTRQDALALLRQCLTNLDKLRLSTIDSFFSSILKCFSNELSIFSEIKIDDEISHKSAAEKIVGEILREKSSDRKTFAEFSEIVKRASFGVEEKSMREILLEKVFAAHGKILETPNLSLWGNAREILGHEPQKWDAAAYDSDRAALRDALAAAKLDGKFAGVEKFFADSNNNILADAKTLEQRLAEMYATGGLNAAFTVKIGRGETEVPAEVAAPLKRLLRACSTPTFCARATPQRRSEQSRKCTRNATTRQCAGAADSRSTTFPCCSNRVRTSSERSPNTGSTQSSTTGFSTNFRTPPKRSGTFSKT